MLSAEEGIGPGCNPRMRLVFACHFRGYLGIAQWVGFTSPVRWGVKGKLHGWTVRIGFVVVRMFRECARRTSPCALNLSYCAGSVIDEEGIMRLKEANPGEGNNPGQRNSQAEYTTVRLF